MREQRLRIVVDNERAACRTLGCDFFAAAPLGFCDPCSAVYSAAHALRERLLERDSAYLRARHGVLFDALAPAVRDRLLHHMAAQRYRGRVPEAGLDDLLRELQDIDFDGEVLR